MSPLIQQLHAIEGLDAISHWPLAIGWWVLIACALLALGSALWLLSCRLKYLKSWKRDALKRLDSLERNLSLSTSGETIAFLSEYLRRIAMRRFPRKECAGIVGDAWLKWLKEQDPKQFNWTEKGRPLIEIPYAPAHRDLPMQQIKELIQAVRYWVS